MARLVGPNSQGGNVFFMKYGGPSGGFLLSGGGIIILCVIRRHFLACEDIAGGSDLSAVGTFFGEIQRPFRWVPAVRWRNHYLRRHFLAAAVDPAINLSTYSTLPMEVVP